jgi:hypothetical protein
MIETPEELASILRREYDAAESFYQQIEPLQTLAFQFYEAQPLGNEVEGRSQIVLPDVQEAVDYMSPSILRTFTSGDRVVEFEACCEEDEEAAEDATAAVDYQFMRRQDGYRVLGDVLNDGLLRKYGVFKACVEKRERVNRQTQIMPADALGMLPPDIEIEEVEELDEATVSVTLKQVRVESRYTGVSIPTWAFRFSPDARHEDTANYIAHCEPKTRGELVEMGFDRNQVYDLPGFMRVEDHMAESDRLDHFHREESSEALQLVELCEEYARIDVDGDGIAERVKVFRVENEILRWQGEPVLDEFTGEQVIDERGEPVFEEGELAIETVDEQPFAVFCPFPRPHRFVGYSLADKVMDVQYLRTMLARQMIDGMAFANLPRPIVAMSQTTDDTLDDILSPIPGSPIRVQSPGAVTPMQNSFSIGQSLNALEWATGERESRTGITRLNQGLDADALNKTATGTALMQAQGQQQEESIARQLAEAFGRFCQKLYRMMREDGQPFQIRVDGAYRMVNPSEWPEEINMRVRVGLGTNSKDKRIAARMALYGPLTAAMGEGLAGPEHAFKWMDGMARDTGIGRGEDFMFNPDDPEREEEGEQPDPAMAELQAKMELERAKAAADVELQREKAAADIELQREKHVFEMQAARERAALEIELGIEKARARMAAGLDIPRQRMGGDLAV